MPSGEVCDVARSHDIRRGPCTWRPPTESHLINVEHHKKLYEALASNPIDYILLVMVLIGQ